MTMQTRKDLFQAHRLMTQRASLALLRGEPDIPDQPLRRLNIATISGVLVAVIAIVIFLIWGLLGHVGSSLRNQPGTLILDKDTGQPYVFCYRGRLLCPVVNYASARLALASDSVTQQSVSQASLGNFRRGPLIGIPGLPPLPNAGQLVRQPWSVCTQTGINPGIGQTTTTTLSVGLPTGGSSLGSGELLTQAQGQDWVVWDNERLPVQPSALNALQSETPTLVPSTWLDALPQGPAFAPPVIAGRGEMVVNGPAGIPAEVGQVYQVSGLPGGTQYYVLLRDGLASITQTQDKLMQFEPNEPSQRTLTAAQVTADTSRSSPAVPNNGLPPSIPTAELPAASAALCVVYTASAAGGSTLTPQVVSGGRLPQNGVKTGIPADVDQVALPPGTGALVGDATGTSQGAGTISYFLVTAGRRYALAETEVVGWLGYSLSQAVLLPPGVVDLIPQGPAFNTTQANESVQSGG